MFGVGGLGQASSSSATGVGVAAVVIIGIVVALVVVAVLSKKRSGGSNGGGAVTCYPPSLGAVIAAGIDSQQNIQSAPLPQRCTTTTDPTTGLPVKQVCDGFEQDWYNLASGSSDPRYLSVATPSSGPGGRPVPPGGWPVLLYLDLMDSTGHYGPSALGGVRETWPTDPKTMRGWDVISSLLKMILDTGIAVVCTTLSKSGTYAYVPDTGLGYSFTCDSSSVANGCYNGGNNPDSPYLSSVLSFIGQQQQQSPSLNANRVALMGYSVSAQEVSSLLEHWPADAFDPKAVVLLAGGSLYCYAYPGISATSPLPDAFKPCDKDPAKRGCCPHSITEPRFDLTPGAASPPTLVVQQTDDFYADPMAARKYFETRKAHGNGPVCLTEFNGSDHGPALSQQGVIISFLRHYLGV